MDDLLTFLQDKVTEAPDELKGPLQLLIKRNFGNVNMPNIDVPPADDAGQ